MKTIRRFFNNAEAGFAQSLLVSVGIDAVLADANANTLGPQYVPWGVRLQVPEEDEARALEILDKHEGFAPLPDDFEEQEEVTDGNKTAPPRVEAFNNLRGLIPAGLCVLAAIGAAYGLYLWLAPLNWTHSEAELVNIGNAAADKKDYARAVACYDAALIINPQSRTAHYDRGLAFLEENDYGKAAADFTESIKIDSQHARSYSMRGFAYYKMDKYDEALDDLNKAIQLDPENYRTYDHRSLVYYQKGEYDKAMNDSDESIRINPENAKAYVNRSLIYIRKKEYAKALDDVNEAVRLDPKDALAYRDRGGVYYKQGAYDSALDQYNKAIDIDPKNYRGYIDRGEAYSKKGDAGKAIADYNRAVNLAPDQSTGYNNLAWVYATCPKAEVRDGAKAMELAQKACELSKWKNCYCIGTLAAAEAETGRYEDAVKHGEQALEMAKADKTIDEKMLDEMADALADYQQKKPYRDVTK